MVEGGGEGEAALASRSEKLPRNLLPSTLKRFKKFVLPMFATASMPSPDLNPRLEFKPHPRLKPREQKVEGEMVFTLFGQFHFISVAFVFSHKLVSLSA